jgi:hypothetical protein
MTIPSVPGYAKPFAHVTMGSGNLPPPPAPPSSSPPANPWSTRPSESSSRLLETSLDDDDVRNRADTAERVRLRSRSMGQILETNFDADGDDNPVNGESSNISHSRDQLHKTFFRRSSAHGGIS